MASVAKTIVCVFFGLMLLGLIIEHPWAACAGDPGGRCRCGGLASMAQLKVLEEFAATVAHRAEDEDKLVNEGDPRWQPTARIRLRQEEDSK